MIDSAAQSDYSMGVASGFRSGRADERRRAMSRTRRLLARLDDQKALEAMARAAYEDQDPETPWDDLARTYRATLLGDERPRVEAIKRLLTGGDHGSVA